MRMRWAIQTQADREQMLTSRSLIAPSAGVTARGCLLWPRWGVHASRFAPRRHFPRLLFGDGNQVVVVLAAG